MVTSLIDSSRQTAGWRWQDSSNPLSRQQVSAESQYNAVVFTFLFSRWCLEFISCMWCELAWMPDELSPAHNIVCSGSSVWHRSIEEKLCLVWKPTRPIKLSGRASYDAGQIPRAELPGRAASGGHTGLVPGSGEERCLRAAGSTHIWRHSALFSPVNTKTSERASAAVVTYYVALIGCRSFYFLVRLKHAP